MVLPLQTAPFPRHGPASVQDWRLSPVSFHSVREKTVRDLDQGLSVPLSSRGAPEGTAPEPPGPQQCQPLAECPLRNRLVNAQAPAAREQAVPVTVAEAVTAVSHDGHLSFLLRLIVTALGVLPAATHIGANPPLSAWESVPSGLLCGQTCGER